jgi:hypothetical protein
MQSEGSMSEMTTETKTEAREMSDEELGRKLGEPCGSWAELGRKARELLEPDAEERGRRKTLALVTSHYRATFSNHGRSWAGNYDAHDRWLAGQRATSVAEQAPAAQTAGGQDPVALTAQVERLTRERDDLESWKEHAMASLGRWNKLHSELQRGPYAVRRGHYMPDEVVRILREQQAKLGEQAMQLGEQEQVISEVRVMRDQLDEQRAKLEAQAAEIERLRSTNVLMREAMSTFPSAPLPTPAEVYISARTDDGTELACERRSAWDARADHNGVTGSPFRVVSEFSATSWDEAMREHNYIHGLGEYKPIEATPMPRLETELSRLWSECIKPSGLSESMTWMGTDVFRCAARADLAEARKADAARIAELEAELAATRHKLDAANDRSALYASQRDKAERELLAERADRKRGRKNGGE